MKMNFSSYIQKILQTQNQNTSGQVAGGVNSGKEEILSKLSVFTGASAEDVSNIDMEKLLEAETASEAVGENASADDKVLAEMVKALMELDGVQTAADTDGDGKLSAEEATAFLNDIIGKDGDVSSLTMEDIDTVIEELGIDLQKVAEETIEEILNEDKVEEIEAEEEVSKAKEAQQPQSSGGTNGSGSAGGAGRSSGGTSVANNKPQGLDGMTLKELEAEKSTREATLQEKQDAVNAVHNGENEAVKSAQEDYDKAEEEYNEAVKNDDQIPQELKEQQAANIAAIDENEGAIDKKSVEINNTQGEVDTLENSVTSLKSNLSTLESSLSSLPSPSGKEEDAEKDAQIEEKKQNIEKQIEDKKKEVETEQDKLDKKQESLKNAKDEKTDLEKTKTDLETEREKIEAAIEKTCSEETKEAMQAYNEAKTNLETVKSEQLKVANADLDTAKRDVTEVNEKITEVKNKEIEKENKVYDGNLPEGLMKGSLAGQEDKICEIADKYGLEPEFLAAIIGLESGWGTSSLSQSNNNFGGVSGSGDAGSTVRSSDGHKFAKYSSVEAGLDAMAKNLASYADRFSDVNSVDINNVNAIGGHYCVGGDWANKVTEIYKMIKSKQA